MHDRCYDRAKCPMYLEYFVPYLWKCYYTIPLCGKMIQKLIILEIKSFKVKHAL